ncbi:MAG TPA: cupin domain-containing protein [Actinobacteria bacterium]|jgi:mannose-6-phosphate isomerase-like protein (cupin superfamily)|nr:cupin domain-containing protein [Actinomycetota bacterium]
MKYVVNVQSMTPDLDPRSLRERVKNRDKVVLRDTYYLINPEDKGCESRRLTLGHTTIYPTGTTTGHSHDDMEEVYYVVMGEGTMVVDKDEYEIKPGDALYVPPGVFHTTKQTGNLPLVVVWVTCKID